MLSTFFVTIVLLLPEFPSYYILLVRVSSLSYPACNAHAPYYIVMCPDWLYRILSTLSRKRYDFRKNVIGHKCVF
jgi:hypothetical protein